MEDVASLVFDFFMERHIALKEEWLSNVLSYLTSSFEGKTQDVLDDPLRIASLVFEQWKYADLEDSTYPILEQLSISQSTSKTFLRQPIVLQVNSVVDIGASYHSQFSALVYEFVDNTGFEPLPEMDQGSGLDTINARPRRMLSFTVSDGETDLRAIEYYSIKCFSLLTKPGSKILLVPPVLCRKGVILLKPRNVQLLGGDVESFFITARPLQIMAEKLNVAIPISKKQVINSDKEAQRSVESREASTRRERNEGKKNEVMKPVIIPSGPDAPILHDEDYDFDPGEFEQEEVYNGIEDDYMKVNDPIAQAVTDSCPTADVNENCRFSAVFHDPSHTMGHAYSKPVAQISPMKSAECNAKAQSRDRSQCIIELEETPPDFDAEMAILSSAKTYRFSSTSSDETTNSARVFKERSVRVPDDTPPSICEDSGNSRKRPSAARAQPSLISLCDSQAETSGLKQIPYASFDPSRRPVKLGIQGFLQSASPSTRTQASEKGSITENTPKKVKIEVIDLEDDEEEVKPDSTTLSSNLTQSCRVTQTEPEPLKSPQCNSEDELLLKFRSLNVVRIADASKQMRFAVGSCRRTVQVLKILPTRLNYSRVTDLAIILDIVDSLRIVDGMWTMKVCLRDESIDSFACLIDSSTLSSLIGLTPAEALEIRASSDIERRKDGQRRLGAVEEQLKRLDLLIDVELFSGGRADPVIRSIRTFMQALGIL